MATQHPFGRDFSVRVTVLTWHAGHWVSLKRRGQQRGWRLRRDGGRNTCGRVTSFTVTGACFDRPGPWLDDLLVLLLQLLLLHGLFFLPSACRSTHRKTLIQSLLSESAAITFQTSLSGLVMSSYLLWANSNQDYTMYKDAWNINKKEMMKHDVWPKTKFDFRNRKHQWGQRNSQLHKTNFKLFTCLHTGESQVINKNP